MSTVIEKAVDWAIIIADDDSHGYDQNTRWGGVDYDCSSFVISAYNQAGAPVKTNGASSTSDMYNAFKKSGFKDVTSKINLSTGEGLERGDVLLTPAKHTAICMTSNKIVYASQNEKGGITGGKTGDQTGKEIYVRAYYNHPWKYVLRYSDTASKGSNLKTWEDIVTAEKLDNAFGGVLKGLGKLFIKYGIAYQCNPALAAAISMHETGNGTSNAAKNKKNLFGFMTNGGATLATFSTYEESIKKGIRNLSINYLNKKLNTLRKIQQKYCPIGAANDPNNLNVHWYQGVETYYKKITGKSPSDLGSGVKSDDVANTNLQAIQDGTIGDGGATGTGQSSQKEITEQAIMGTYGEQMTARNNPFVTFPTFNGGVKKNISSDTPDIELYIVNWGKKIFAPILKDNIQWETTYSGTAAQLTFTVIKDENIAFHEGSQVIFKYQGMPLFYGFVFKKTRDKEHHIKCICYDQTRYLQNKNSMVYSNKTATELIEMIAKDFSLKTGDLIDTDVKIPLRVEDNTSLFDIIQYALDYTTQQTGELYTFYDDFGKLTLKKSVDMKSNCVITKDNAENFDYTSSINESTYTRIKRYFDNKETGVREIYTYDESAKRPYYGVLQLCEKIEDENINDFVANAEKQMKRDLAQYSAPTRTLEIKGVIGDVMVRGGSLVCVSLDLGDIIVNSQENGYYFVCDSVKHTFENGYHYMDVYLTGGGYRFI